MHSISRRLSLPAVAGVFGLMLLILPSRAKIAAQQQAQRPSITAAILLREGDQVTLDRGSQHGLRKGDKLQVFHSVNGKPIPAGTVVVIKVFGTTSYARVTEQNGTVGPEDVAIFNSVAPAPAPTPREPTRGTPSEPTRKAPDEPARRTPAQPARKAAAEPGRKTSKEPVTSTSNEPVRSTLIEPIRKVDTPLPLLPQFSGDKAGGASFAFDYTNETEKVVDTSIYRLSARLLFDGQDYRTSPTTLTENYNVAPGKTRTFSLHLTDFTLANDKDVWPLKSGRHTIIIKFGGKQYGPLTFDWRGDNATK